MKKLLNLSRSQLVSTLLFLSLSSAPVFSQEIKSPVGDWELSIARTGRSAKETGTVFLTFNTNNTFAGYGLTTATFEVFTLSGTWDVDAKGKLTGQYTQTLFDEPLDATFTGKVNTGKRIEMNAEGLLGTFKYSGVPARPLPDLSGAWSSTLIQTTNRIKSIEAYQFTNSIDFPAVYGIMGNGTNANRSFAVSGIAIVTAAGKVTAFKLNDFGGDKMTSDTLRGKFHSRQNTISLTGIHTDDLDSVSVRARLSRP
jgi:hypothetical protein